MSNIKIGVDARSLCDQLTGIGRYTLEILSHLVSMDYQWILYSHKPILHGNWKRDNVQTCCLNLSSRISRMLWAQSILPLWLSRDNVNLFWSPSHRIPTLLSSTIPSVVTIHDLVWKHAGSTMRPLSRFLDSYLIPNAIIRANKVIAVSNSTATDIKSHIPSAADKLSVIYLGFTKFPDYDKSKIFSKLSINKSYILFVGTMEPRKNIIGLIKAFSMLDNDIKSKYLLVLVGGEGWGGVDIGQLCVKYGITSQARIAGYLSDGEIGALYSNALFLAMPSFYEGFGLPLVEAMQYGTPSITSNVSSMPEIAGSSGFIINPSDTNSIAEGLRSLLVDKSLLDELRIKARERSEDFNWELSARLTLNLFKNVLQNY